VATAWWVINPHFDIEAQFVHGIPFGALEHAGGNDAIYGLLEASLHF